MTPFGMNEADLKRKRNLRVTKQKSQSRSESTNGKCDCEYCESNHAHRQCPAFGLTSKNCVKKNHFAKKCHCNKSHSSTGSKHKSFKYHKVNLDQESCDDNGQIDEITSKVKSMYYHDVHLNSVNIRMYINLNTKSCNGSSMKTCFKVDTGADGNLPLCEFLKHFPEANLNDLAKTVDPYTKLYAYYNDEIK